MTGAAVDNRLLLRDDEDEPDDLLRFGFFARRANEIRSRGSVALRLGGGFDGTGVDRGEATFTGLLLAASGAEDVGGVIRDTVDLELASVAGVVERDSCPKSSEVSMRTKGGGCTNREVRCGERRLFALDVCDKSKGGSGKVRVSAFRSALVRSARFSFSTHSASS